MNLDVAAPDFAEQLKALPQDGSYVVYCRSGNRSAQAAAVMADAGHLDVVDAGSLGDASEATGLPVVAG